MNRSALINLEDVCVVRRGTVITERDTIPGDVPVVSGGVKPKYYHSKANRPANTITVSGSGNAGYISYWFTPIFASDCTTIEPIDSSINIRYIYHNLLSKQQFIYDNLRSGAVLSHVYAKDIAKIKINLHKPEKQKLIVETLDKIEALKQKRQRALDLLYEFKQSIFIDMFGDPILNPNGWPSEKLGDLTSKIGSGATPRGGEATYKEFGIPFVRSMNVRDGTFLKKGLAYIDGEQAKALDNAMVQSQDILLNITGSLSGASAVARVCRAPDELDGARVNQHVAIIRPTEKLSNEFLEYQLLAPKFKTLLLKNAEGSSSRQGITKSKLKNIVIIVPPIELQRSFSKRINDVMAIETRSIISRAKLDEFFTSFQRQVFLK